MREDRYDVIIVGGGLAGSAAAYTLAKAGVKVIVIERGETCGCKNMTGGRLYGHSLKRLIPDYEKLAPLERRIIKERVSLMSSDSATTVEFCDEKLGGRNAASYSVIRADLDKWLAEQAEKKGATYINGIRVDELVVRNGKVCGVRAGEDTLEANVVILADGVNSLLAVKAGLVEHQDSREYAVGAKEVIRLGEETINERFGIRSDEGVAWMFAGSPTGGGLGGGFLYTNRDTLSVGVVATVSDIGYAGAPASRTCSRSSRRASRSPRSSKAGSWWSTRPIWCRRARRHAAQALRPRRDDSGRRGGHGHKSGLCGARHGLRHRVRPACGGDIHRARGEA